jgi:hypothetical protein
VHIVPQNIEELDRTKQLIKYATFVIGRSFVEPMEILAGDLVGTEPNGTFTKDIKIVGDTEYDGRIEQGVETESEDFNPDICGFLYGDEMVCRASGRGSHYEFNISKT